MKTQPTTSTRSRMFVYMLCLCLFGSIYAGSFFSETGRAPWAKAPHAFAQTSIKDKVEALTTPVATAATGVQATQFTANWQSVENAEAYDVAVYTKAVANLVKNGGFETGDFTDWTSSSNWKASSTAQSGNHGIQWNSGTAKLEQEVPVEIGETYIMTFWYTNYNASGNGLKNFTVQASGGTNYIDAGAPALPSASTWTKYEKEFIPTGNTIKISIRAYVACNIDDISVVKKGSVASIDIDGSPFTVAGALSQTITDLDPNTTYFYTVTAKAESGAVVSEVSNEISVETLNDAVEPAIATPAAGRYATAQTISLSCVTPDAKIEYKLRLSGNTWTEYSDPFLLSSSDTLDIRTSMEDLEPTLVEGLVYEFPIDVATIAAFKATSSETNSTLYKITGDVVFVWRNGSNMYIKDQTGGLLVYDNSNKISTSYTEGDVISGGVVGTLTIFNGIYELVPFTNTAAGTAGTTIEPITLTMSDLLANFTAYQSQLVRLEGVTFASSTAFGTSTSTRNISISQDDNSMFCRNHYSTISGWQADLAQQYVVTGFVTPNNTDLQICPRGTSDLEILCGVPTDLTSENITSSAVTLSWSGISANYDVAYKIEEDGEYTTVSADATSKALSDLYPDTTYTYKVRGNCGSDNLSDWSEEKSFRTLAENVPNIIVDLQELNFPPTLVNTATANRFDVAAENLDTDLSYSLTVGTVFSVEAVENAWDVRSGGSLDVTFTPTSAATIFYDTLKIESGTTVRLIALQGIGVVPALTVDSSEINFGTVEQGNPQTVILKINASFIQNPVNLAITGTNSDLFSVDSTTLTPVDGVLSNKIVKVTYNPTILGEHQAMLTVTGSGVDPIELVLSAISVPAPVVVAQWNGYTSPAPADGQFLATDGIAANKGLAVLVRESTGNADAVNSDGIASTQNWHDALTTEKYWMTTFSTLEYGHLTVTSKQRGSNTGPKDFKIQYKIGESAWTDVENGAITVGNDAYVTGVKTRLPLPEDLDNQASVSLRWLATSENRISGSDPVASGGSNRLDVAVFASKSYPAITVSPNTFDFGDITSNTTSSPQILTVSGQNLVAPLSYEKSGTDADAFNISETAWTAGEGGELSITFTPTEARIYNASITIQSTDAIDKTVTLTGNGAAAGTPILNVNKDSLEFGNLHVNSESARQSVEISAANLTNLAYRISDDQNFGLTEEDDNFGATGGTLNVVFKPQSTGVKSAVLYIESTELSDSVLIFGTGVVSALSAIPDVINAGEVMEGRHKAIQVKINAQYLTQDVTLAISGTDAGMFSLDKEILSKPENGTMTDSIATVTYAPTNTSAHTALLTISSTGTQDVTIPLSGQGTEYMFLEDFETTLSDVQLSSKGGYTATDYTLITGEWRVCAVGQMTASDHHNGAVGLRFRGNANDTEAAQNMVQMNFDKANGVGTLSFKYGSYSSHKDGQLFVQISSDSGQTWQDRGGVITVPAWSDEMLTATVVINKVAPCRIRIVKQSQNGSTSVNIDDISITDWTTVAPGLNISGDGNFGTPMVPDSVVRSFSVGGEDLTGNITYHVTGDDSSAFTVREDTWNPASGGKLDVVFKPTTAKTYHAELVISSTGAEDARIELTATAISEVKVANIAAFKEAAGTVTSVTPYTITGDVVFVFRNGRNFYIQDNTGGLLIDNAKGVITGNYTEGDVISGGVSGTLSMFNGLRQFVPTQNLAAGTTGSPVTPTTLTISELLEDFDRYESSLIKLENVAFTADETFGTSSSGGNLTITQDDTTLICRNHFNTFTGFKVSADEFYHIVGFAIPYNADRQIAPRDSVKDIRVVGDLSITPTFETHVTIYPNPVTDMLYIQSEQSVSTLMVYSLSGKLVAQQYGQNHINLSSLAKGSYVIRITLKNGVTLSKIIVK